MEIALARRMFAGLPVASVASLDRDGWPHVVPLWFIWPDEALYVSTHRASRTWRNASLDPRVALTIDLGRAWTDLAGITIGGRAAVMAAEDAAMRGPISMWHEKYRSLLAGDAFGAFAETVEHLAFLRVIPLRVATWDHARS